MPLTLRLEPTTLLARLITILPLLPLLIAASDVQPEQGDSRRLNHSHKADRFMVAAAHPQAVEAGYAVLKRGGTAADAGIAVQLVLNLVEPQSSGIGGGAFALYWDAGTQQLSSYDGRETAPSSATPSYFLQADGKPLPWWEAVVGGQSVGVPGTVKLLETLHQQHGNQVWSSLFTPAIELAEQGFEVSPRLAHAIAVATKHGLREYEPARAYFYTEDGEPLPTGHVLQNPALVRSFAAIAKDGASAFYEGPIAEALLLAVRGNARFETTLSLADLKQYRVIERLPVCHEYREYQICGMGPPSSGALTVGQILGMLENFDLPQMGLTAESVHLYSEAAKLAYADRGKYMADSDYVPLPLAGLLDKSYLAQRAKLIRAGEIIETPTAGTPPETLKKLAELGIDEHRELPGTSHISIVDRYGNVLSMTTTIETGFGSRVMSNGFLLNNELTDFSMLPVRDGKLIANRVEGGKRPRSSMAPTIVFKQGVPYLVLGSPGGSRIINYVAKTLVAILDWQMPIQEALNLGHFVSRYGEVDLEQDTEIAKLAPVLEEWGHKTKARDLNSGLHAILIEGKRLTGAADPRREGRVMGD